MSELEELLGFSACDNGSGMQGAGWALPYGAQVGISAAAAASPAQAPTFDFDSVPPGHAPAMTPRSEAAYLMAVAAADAAAAVGPPPASEVDAWQQPAAVAPPSQPQPAAGAGAAHYASDDASWGAPPPPRKGRARAKQLVVSTAAAAAAPAASASAAAGWDARSDASSWSSRSGSPTLSTTSAATAWSLSSSAAGPSALSTASFSADAAHLFAPPFSTAASAAGGAAFSSSAAGGAAAAASEPPLGLNPLGVLLGAFNQDRLTTVGTLLKQIDAVDMVVGTVGLIAKDARRKIQQSGSAVDAVVGPVEAVQAQRMCENIELALAILSTQVDSVVVPRDVNILGAADESNKDRAAGRLHQLFEDLIAELDLLRPPSGRQSSGVDDKKGRGLVYGHTRLQARRAVAPCAKDPELEAALSASSLAITAKLFLGMDYHSALYNILHGNTIAPGLVMPCWQGARVAITGGSGARGSRDIARVGDSGIVGVPEADAAQRSPAAAAEQEEKGKAYAIVKGADKFDEGTVVVAGIRKRRQSLLDSKTHLAKQAAKQQHGCGGAAASAAGAPSSASGAGDGAAAASSAAAAAPSSASDAGADEQQQAVVAAKKRNTKHPRQTVAERVPEGSALACAAAAAAGVPLGYSAAASSEASNGGGTVPLQQSAMRPKPKKSSIKQGPPPTPTAASYTVQQLGEMTPQTQQRVALEATARAVAACGAAAASSSAAAPAPPVPAEAAAGSKRQRGAKAAAAEPEDEDAAEAAGGPKRRRGGKGKGSAAAAAATAEDDDGSDAHDGSGALDEEAAGQMEGCDDSAADASGAGGVDSWQPSWGAALKPDVAVRIGRSSKRSGRRSGGSMLLMQGGMPLPMEDAHAAAAPRGLVSIVGVTPRLIDGADFDDDEDDDESGSGAGGAAAAAVAAPVPAPPAYAMQPSGIAALDATPGGRSAAAAAASAAGGWFSPLGWSTPAGRGRAGGVPRSCFASPAGTSLWKSLDLGAGGTPATHLHGQHQPGPTPSFLRDCALVAAAAGDSAGAAAAAEAPASSAAAAALLTLAPPPRGAALAAAAAAAPPAATAVRTMPVVLEMADEDYDDDDDE